MQHDTTEITWISETHTISAIELAKLCRISEIELRHFTQEGIVAPVQGEPETFSGNCIGKLKTICRLRDELELEEHALGVVMSLLERIEQLETEVRLLRPQHI